MTDGAVKMGAVADPAPDLAPVPGAGELVLALEAAGGACSVALGRVTASAPVVLAAEKQDMQHGHATALVPMIDKVMQKAGAEMAAVDAIAVGIGPGGFTGLRIALATARGLGLALGKPVIGISNFQATAWRARADGATQTGDILVLLDSRRSEPYVAWLDANLAFRAPPVLLAPESLAGFITHAAPELITGDGIAAAGEIVGTDRWPAASQVVPSMADAVAVLHLAVDVAGRFRAAAQPSYLRDPDVSFPKAG